jgi:predicted nuclease with TOPRIM domain
MHLERVTTRHGEAGLAGWIASNDVTLFTTALVVAIAIFLQAKLTRGAKENLALTDQNKSLSLRLASTASELDSVSELLDKTAGELHLTQVERDQLQKQLVEKLDKIAKLDSALESLLGEKGRLEKKQRQLVKQSESLSQEKTELLAQQAALADAGKSLKASNATLRDRLETLAAQLEDKLAALAEVEKERARLNQQADKLADVVASLKKKLEELNVKLIAAEHAGTAQRVASDEKVQQLETKLAESNERVEDYLAKLKEAAVLLEGLKKQNRELQVTITKTEQERQQQLLEEGRNNRELVGLKGPMKRVAILFDASGSMLRAGTNGSHRWADAQDIAATWLRHLNVEECVLIVFASDVRTFPTDGTVAKVHGKEGAATREMLLSQLKSVAPAGQTNTLAALQKAYEYNVDTILLLSDGAPTLADNGMFEPRFAQQIYELVGKHAGVPINTIGLGNYFDKDMSTFLMTLARITGGAFRGA